MIEKFINYITLEKKVEYYPEMKETFNHIFCGDGFGDFEKRDDSASLICLTNYIIDCEDQIKIARDYMKSIV